MGVNVRCEICGTIIRRVETSKIHTIKEDELCDGCHKKVDEIFQDYKKGEEKFTTALNKLNVEAEKQVKRINVEVENLYKEFKVTFTKSHNELKELHGRYLRDMKSLFTTTSAELNHKIMKVGRYLR